MSCSYRGYTSLNLTFLASWRFHMLHGILKQNEPLARHTSWRVGGVARQTYRPTDIEDLAVFLASLAHDEKLLWLGLGSNVLIRDGGFDGTVIITQGRLAKLDPVIMAPEVIQSPIIRAEAGVPCAKMAKYCARLGYTKAAFFAGVPGTVGGALAMNAGAFGGETWKYVVATETIDHRGQLHIRKPEEFQIAYRNVVRPDNEWFVAGHFAFPTGNADEAAQAIRDLLRQRTTSQPIGEFSCGSVFRNPTGDHAARLIEASGLKGLRQGGAWVSEKHANFIINGGEATAADIEDLIQMVQEKVEKLQGVRLIPEVHILGDPALK